MAKQYVTVDDCCILLWCFGTDDVWPNGIPVLTGDELEDPRALVSLPGSAVDIPGAGAADSGYALRLNNDEDRAGEEWGDVIQHGDGIYSHVEEVAGGRFINIEYTVLWAYNGASCSHHHGDLTTITVVYDPICDLVTRVGYYLHGTAIEAFRVADVRMISLSNRPGFPEPNGRYNLQGADVARIAVGEDDEWQMGNNHSPSEPVVLFGRDPVSGLYEHPLMYVEHGSHEAWPNPSGEVTYAPDHNGDGLSFLPDTVQVLGTLDTPAGGQAPFLLYNGKFGTDPVGIIRHAAWFWPEGRDSNRYWIPMGRFTDMGEDNEMDPYRTHETLMWPPAPEFANGPGTFYVNGAAGAEFDGSANGPFPDPSTASSFVPSGATVSVRAGAYPGGARFNRHMRFVSSGGAVRIGGP